MEQKHSRQDPRAAQRTPQEGRERPAARPGAGERRQTSARSETQGRRSAPAAGTRSANALALWVRRLRRQIRRLRRRVENLRAEERAYNFPESDALPVQLLLLGWNMLPMLGSLLWERIQGVRRGAAQRVGGLLGRCFGKIPRRKLHPAAFIGGGCALLAVVLVCSTYTLGVTVSYDGEVVAAVANQSAADEVRSNLESVTTRTLGEDFTIDDSLIQYSAGLLNRQEVVDEATLEEDLSQEIGLVTMAYSLYVDGELVGATPYEGAL